MKNIKTLVKEYSPWLTDQNDIDKIENEVGLFKCSCCGEKYPNGRESLDDTNICDNCAEQILVRAQCKILEVAGKTHSSEVEMAKGDKKELTNFAKEVIDNVPVMWNYMVEEDGRVAVRIPVSALKQVMAVLEPNSTIFEAEWEETSKNERA